ncbi:hypothetical protein Sjap_007066 [Stephania japonica]|uniref:Knotted 1-binding protein 36 n=1 Tax=Stephania japonica TaxID=461633 RepID=A0AAP0K706_9MAGN
MENEDVEAGRKRQRQTDSEEENRGGGGGGGGQDSAAEGDIEASFVGSEEMQMQINSVLEKIERFTQLVSELLESGKTLFKELSDQFEERLITIHREEIEKWQEEIKALRMLDMSNEEANMLLLNAKQLLHNVQMET